MRDLDELVARRENRHTGTAMHFNIGKPKRREHADLCRAERGASRNRRPAFDDVFAARANILAGVAVAADLHLACAAIGVLDSYDRICPVGYGSTGHNPRGGASFDSAGRKAAGRYGLGNTQHGWQCRKVGTLHGVAIHRRVVPGRKGDRGDRVAGEDQPIRIEQRDTGGAERPHIRENARDGFRHFKQRVVGHQSACREGMRSQPHEDSVLHAFDVAVRHSEIIA